MITFILVEPQMGENIGAAMRVMANFGFTHLRLVSPRDGWPNPAALSMAASAKDLVTHISVHTSLTEAIADQHYCYAITARQRSMSKPMHWSHELPSLLTAPTQTGQRIALVFGPERSGLANDDVALTHHIITIPTVAAMKSLNLAQAVAVLAYECRHFSAPLLSMNNEELLATQEEVDHFIQLLLLQLEEKNYFNLPDKKERMHQSIINLFKRTSYTPAQVKTLHGILRTLVGRQNS